jgi:tetratricopeptide (TPR) repeat protein
MGRTVAAEEAFEKALRAEDAEVVAKAALSLGFLRAARGDLEAARDAWHLALQAPNAEQADEAREYLALLDEANTSVIDAKSATASATQISPGTNEDKSRMSESGGLLPAQVRLTNLSPLDEAIALYADDPDGSKLVLQHFQANDVFGLGDVAAVQGTESDLLHFTIGEGTNEHTLLPVFTQPSIMRRALIRNPEWQTLSVLQLSGRALFDNVDDDVAIVINPWSRLEYQLPRRSTILDRAEPGKVTEAGDTPRSGARVKSTGRKRAHPAGRDAASTDK